MLDLPLTKSIPFFVFSLLAFNSSAETFTFMYSGDYSDTSNWDNYPGTVVENGDTLLILEDININVFLNVYDGVVLFESNVDEVVIHFVTIWYDSLLKIEATYFQFDIHGELYFEGGSIEHPNLFDITIINTGNGINGNYNNFFFVSIFIYHNLGTQDSSLFYDFDGLFINEGTIMVEFGNLYLNCDLELSSGTIEGLSSFEIIQEGGSIDQDCSTCTSNTVNCTSVTISNSEIKGNWVID